MKTLTEKYRGVLSESFSKKQFIRDAKIAHPALITPLNGFNDTVKILKNKGFISEKEEMPKMYGKYEIEGIKSDDKFSIEAIERGIDAELEAMGLMSQESITKEDYGKAKEKAIKNLEKDQNHYLNLMAGESSSVDKHDKMVPADGKNSVDVFNGMKKAELNEVKELFSEGKLDDLAARLGIPVDKLKAASDKIRDMEREKAEKDALKLAKMKEVIDEEEIDEVQEELDKKQIIALAIQTIKGKYHEVSNDMIKDFLNTHMGDLMDGNDPLEEFEQFIDINYDRLNEEEPVSEKKGKDHDGDGDVDSDDYMAAKDKAIKKAMGKDEVVKESLKSIITKVLEEQVVNEAATNHLAGLADTYGDFEGFKQSVIQLQNIISDIESFYDKSRNKIQKVFDSIGDIRNEEGLKVGAFLAPSIEAAFNKDLRPVSKTGFTKGLETPKVRTISKAEIDAAQNMEEEPKQTMFSPVNEKK